MAAGKKVPSTQEKSPPTPPSNPLPFMAVMAQVGNTKEEGLQVQGWAFMESLSSSGCADYGFPVSWACTLLQGNRPCREGKLTGDTGTWEAGLCVGCAHFLPRGSTLA